jgi:hypothetical protein
MPKKTTKLDAATVQVMKKVLAMPPKLHEDMKVGRPLQSKKRGSKGRASCAKPRTA